MSTVAAALRPIPIPRSNELRRDPAAQAFVLLRIAFTVAPILFGLDKFANVLTDDWTKYLSSEFNSLLPGGAAAGMHIVGVIEVVAGLVVLVAPRFGGFLVAAWLGGEAAQRGGTAPAAARRAGCRAWLRAPARSRSATSTARSSPASSSSS